ncbi:hypothetical protein [Inquilinus ginsengisoli]|uniref:hypothetical protein n=1 Tax=Inquilinus ginsengisoli TaxID=363840 RepID=UPI003D1BC28F
MASTAKAISGMASHRQNRVPPGTAILHEQSRLSPVMVVTEGWDQPDAWRPADHEAMSAGQPGTPTAGRFRQNRNRSVFDVEFPLYFIVILGLDPRIQGLSEQLSVALDCRVKPGNDNKG